MNTDVPKRLPTRPLCNWLLAWRIWTGDPPETIARGFDLDEELVVELLGPRPPLMLDLRSATDIAFALQVPTNLLFSARSADELWDEFPDGSDRAVRHL